MTIFYLIQYGVYLNLRQYFFHCVCYFLISNLQSVIDFVFRASHINFGVFWCMKYMFIILNWLKH